MNNEALVTVINYDRSDAAGPSARILVADDQPANIQVVGSMLGKQGYEIVPASDGLTTLKRLALRLPDLILLDVLMPGMDGVEDYREAARRKGLKLLVEVPSESAIVSADRS